jgi:PAS domain S-box-containing protein
MDHKIDLLHHQLADLQAENALLRRRLEAPQPQSTQAALHQSEEKFRLAFQTSPDSINFNRLSDGMYLDINEGFTKLTGYTHAEAVGRTSVDLNIWYDSKDRERLVQALMGHGYVENFESRFRRKNGQIGIGLMSARILNMNGERVILSITRDITDRKIMEEALQKSEEQYRSIFENAIEGFFQSTPEGRFIRVNRAFAKMCGYASPEEMVSAIRDIGEQHYGCRKDRERFLALLNEKGAVESFEHTARRKDGTAFWVSVSARVVRDSNHQILYYEGSHVDIDERKRAEGRLVDAEEQYRSLFDTSTNAILIRNRAGIITMANRAAATLLNAEKLDDLIGRNYLDLVHPEDRLLSVQRIEKIFEMAAGPSGSVQKEMETIRPREHRMVSLAGGIIDVESTGVAFSYKEEFFIQGIFRDITERKQAEEKLRETERKYRELAESLPQVIFEIDSNGKLVYLNHTGYELFGYSPEDVANGFSVLEAFVPDDRERVVQDILTSIQGRRLGRQEYTAVKKSGAQFPVAVHANRVLEDQTTTGLRGILIDLTPTRIAEEEKKKLENQLQQAQKMEAIGALAGGIAHDFNNILSAIIGYTELAMLNEGAEHCADELKEALAAANRAKDLVKQILAFSRQTDEDRMPVRVALIVKEAVKFLRATIPSTIEIKARIDERSGAVLANSVELHQIIMNLFTNAQHALGERAGLVEVEVQGAEIDAAQKSDLIGMQAGACVRISVRDTGSGMSPEVMERIFDPYFTTKEKGVGTGLGLAVVHGIVKKYGGAIQVESKPGQGTVFHVFLPKADVAAPTQTELTKPIMGGSEKVLLVDDEQMLASVGQQALQRLGYEVVSRTSPIEALELFKAKPGHFDVVITDQTMPGMTGDALARELMNIRPGIPVIICTGYSQAIDAERAATIGIKAFVMKPILIHDLADAVRKALGREKASR